MKNTTLRLYMLVHEFTGLRKRVFLTVWEYSQVG